MRNLLILGMLLVIMTNAKAIDKDSMNQKEEVLDLALDIGFVAYDVYTIITTGTGWTALGIDLGCAATPFATGGGAAYRLAHHSSRPLTFTTRTVRGASLASKVHITGNAYSFFSRAKELPRIQINAAQWRQIVSHALERHAASSTADASKFLANNTDELYNLLRNFQSKIDAGDYRMIVNRLDNGNAYSLYVNMGTTIGNKGESILALHFFPGSTGHIGSLFPMKLEQCNRTKLASFFLDPFTH